MNRRRLILIAALFALSHPLHAAEIYFGFHHLDVEQRRIVQDRWMIVDSGRIHRLGQGEPPADFDGTRRDLSGSWALPGLIDAHAHLTAGPHRIEVIDGQPRVTIESNDTITRFNALMALAFGVTTVRNPGSDPAASARYDQQRAAGAWRGPRALHAGSVIQPPPFGGDAFAYPTTRDAWFAEAARQAELGMTYFKLYTGLNAEEIALGIEAARAHGLQAIAHLDEVSWLTALELGIDGLEHALPTSEALLPPETRPAFRKLRQSGSQYLSAWFEFVDYDAPGMRTLFTQLRATRTTVNLTLLVNEMMANADDLTRVVPETDRRFIHPDNWAAMAKFLEAGAGNWTEGDFERARRAMPKVFEFARRLVDNDIRVLIGTDGNGGGPLMAREMALHVEAGIPAWTVLDMATRRAAAALALHDVGELREGKLADVVFLTANPLDDIDALREVHAVLADGHYHLSAALVRDAEALLAKKGAGP